MDYIAFCHDFYAATNIPVSLLEDGRSVYSAIGEELSLPVDTEATMYAPDHNPECCALTPDLEYGRVLIEGTGYDMILGPIFTVPDPDEVARRFIAEQNVPAAVREQLPCASPCEPPPAAPLSRPAAPHSQRERVRRPHFL